MNWKFWKKDESPVESSVKKGKKLSKPKDLPDCIGRYLVVDLNQDPDWVWGLKCVLRPKETRYEFDFHVFDESRARGIGNLNYDVLEMHPELSLYSGLYNKDRETVQMNPVSENRQSAQN